MNYKSNEKMDIGDLGFLIIAFIVFIVNFIVKANKEKSDTDTPKPAKPELPEPWEVEETLPPFYDSDFDINRRSDEFEYQKSSEVLPSFHQPIEKQESYLPETHNSPMSESLFKDDNMESVSYADENDTGESYLANLIDGDSTEELKKAIIYSEILHRKYE